ncbi:MAG: hypothetical protein NVS9B3_04330 [Gemmatimonadaceae bacterium]
MRISFALFADGANLSQEGKLNVLGVFDALHVGTVPAVHPRAHIVVRLKGTSVDVGTHSVTFSWKNPAGRELWSTTGQIAIGEPPIGTAEMDLPLIAAVDLPLDQSGAYSMDIALDDHPAASVPLAVQAMAPMPSAPAGLLS